MTDGQKTRLGLINGIAKTEIAVFPKPLPLKAQIKAAADDIHKYFFIVFQRK